MCVAATVGSTESKIEYEHMWEQPEVGLQDWRGHGEWRVWRVCGQPEVCTFELNTHTHTTVQTKENVSEERRRQVYSHALTQEMGWVRSMRAADRIKQGWMLTQEDK